MTEELKDASKLPLNQILDQNNFRLLISGVLETRKALDDGRSFTYEEVKFPYNGKVLYVLARHVSLEDIFSNGKGSCKTCYGKGHYFTNVSKKLYPNPGEFLLEQDSLPKDLTPEEQAKWVATEKAKTTWRVLNVCDCAVRASYKKNPRLLANDKSNVWLVLDYEIKDQ